MIQLNLVQTGETEMKIGAVHKIVIVIEGKILTFTGKIISEDASFITFIDKFGTTLNYNKSTVRSAEELK